MTYKLWIRCMNRNTLLQQAVPVLWCCTGVGWPTLPSANVLPSHGLDKCVQMPVVGKQQLYNGFAQAEWFREQWEAGGAAKSVKTAFQERACCWKGRQLSVWERVSVLHWKFLQCLLTCLWFPLFIQGCRQREGDRQSAERARLSEKCFRAAEEKEQRKEILPPPPQKTPQKNQTRVSSTSWGLGHFAESFSDSCVLHCVPGHSFSLGSDSAHLASLLRVVSAPGQFVDWMRGRRVAKGHIPQQVLGFGFKPG